MVFSLVTAIDEISQGWIAARAGLIVSNYPRGGRAAVRPAYPYCALDRTVALPL